MGYRRLVGTLAAVALAFGITACDDGTILGEEPEETSETEAADAPEAPDEEGSAATTSDAGGQPDDLPDEWPDELPVHAGVELGRVMVEESDDGLARLTVQYRTDESIEESVQYLESLADHGWEVDVEEGSEGTNRFVDANLEGHGWSVSVSFENSRYTWGVREQ